MANEDRSSDPSPSSVVRTPATVRARSVSRLPRAIEGGAERPAVLDWPVWLRLIERKRRLLQRNNAIAPIAIPEQCYALATYSSFKIEGIAITQEEVVEGLQRRLAAQRKFRSRNVQRIRNHVAILRTIESSLRLGQPLRTSAVMRWYTSISSGLSTTGLGAERMGRLEQLARRINSPQLRLQPALLEIAQTHSELIADPLFPSFNGILARLLLRYHLGRCALPLVIFDDSVPTDLFVRPQSLTLQLLVAIDQSYDLLLAG
jgi:hypothetical protein